MDENIFYTFNQFYSILGYTLLIIIMIFIFVYYFYRLNECRFRINAIASMMFLSILFDFIGSTAINLSNKIYFYYISFSFFIAHLTLAIIILYIHKRITFKLYEKIYLLLSYSLILIFVFINYEFKPLLSLISLLNFIIILRKYENKGMGASIFRAVKRALSNYVLILGANGEVFYTNDAILNSEYFSIKGTLNINNIADIFNADISIESFDNNNLISLELKQPVYFAYTKKNIYSNGKISGYILTFTNFTDSVDMIEKLREDRSRINNVNIKLKEKKDNIYELEREREITRLLDEIATEQYASMKKLRKDILKMEFKDDDFIDSLNDAIYDSQMNLKKVRKSVSEYKNI